MAASNANPTPALLNNSLVSSSAGVVEMARDARETHGRDRFSCTFEEWHLLLRLARESGWQPQGATYELPPNSKLDEPARRDYEPGEPSDRKRVGAQDAKALARALADAQDSPSFAALVAESSVSHASLTTLMSEFVEYAYGGAFMFTRRDASRVER